MPTLKSLSAFILIRVTLSVTVAVSRKLAHCTECHLYTPILLCAGLFLSEMSKYGQNRARWNLIGPFYTNTAKSPNMVIWCILKMMNERQLIAYTRQLTKIIKHRIKFTNCSWTRVSLAQRIVWLFVAWWVVGSIPCIVYFFLFFRK